MNIGNELYGTLSRLTGESYLLLSELPTMVTICNTNYQIEFSQSYSGCLHSSAFYENIPGVMPLDGAFQSLIQDGYSSLNVQQRHAYNIFLSWCRNTMKNLNSLKPIEIEPIFLFITGGGGAGKSHLIKTIYHTAVKTFRHPPINPEHLTVLLMALQHSQFLKKLEITFLPCQTKTKRNSGHHFFT